MAVNFSTVQTDLTGNLEIIGGNFVEPTRDGIAECVGAIAALGGVSKGQRAKGDTPAIPSTRVVLKTALLDSGFCGSDASASNYADIALLIFAGGVPGIDVKGKAPSEAVELVGSKLLPEATRAGEFVALVRGDNAKAKETPKSDPDRVASMLSILNGCDTKPEALALFLVKLPEGMLTAAMGIIGEPKSAKSAKKSAKKA